MSVPKISFIVSAFDRPEMLRLCLQSLRLQTESSWEAIVMDNSRGEDMHDRHWAAVDQASRGMGLKIRWIITPDEWATDDYWASEYAALHLAKGEWLCFASDDSYYVPQFAERMLGKAQEDSRTSIVYCDLVWGRESTHTMMDCKPIRGFIDKTNFIIRRTAFQPWPNKCQGSYARSQCDGYLVEGLANSGFLAVKVPQLLVVHN